MDIELNNQYITHNIKLHLVCSMIPKFPFSYSSINEKSTINKNLHESKREKKTNISPKTGKISTKICWFFINIRGSENGAIVLQ